MKNDTSENLKDLLGRFVGEAQAETAEEDVRRGQRLLEAYPAPPPDDTLIAHIKACMTAAFLRRRRIAHAVRRAVAVAAAVTIIGAIGLLGRGPATPTGAFHAGIIPSAVWDGDDIAADDLELVYFRSQLRQIEAQMEELEAGEGETAEKETIEDLQMELMRIDSEFWKG